MPGRAVPNLFWSCPVPGRAVPNLVLSCLVPGRNRRSADPFFRPNELLVQDLVACSNGELELRKHLKTGKDLIQFKEAKFKKELR